MLKSDCLEVLQKCEIFTTCKVHHDPHVEFFTSNSKVWKKRYGTLKPPCHEIGPKNSPATKATQSSPATQRIHQKSKFSSFSDREKPLDPSRKNNEGPLPANLGSFGKISPNLHISIFRSPMEALPSFRG